jgi:hypothetical protein
MEMPTLGKHCSLKSCNRLDFLPVTCTFCKEIFCTDHGYTTTAHACPKKNEIKDVKVEVCEKCNKRKKENHVCMKRKNKCTVDNCKSRIVVPITCSGCFQSVCARHRFPSDHNCLVSNVARMRIVSAY